MSEFNHNQDLSFFLPILIFYQTKLCWCRINLQ